MSRVGDWLLKQQENENEEKKAQKKRDLELDEKIANICSEEEV